MNKSVYTSEKGTHNMLLAARILVIGVCGLEIAFALIFFMLPFNLPLIGEIHEEELITFFRVLGSGLLIHGIIGLVTSIFMTWYISSKQIIYLIVSGILLLLPSLIIGIHVNFFVGIIYIYAGVLCIKHNKKAQEEVREERERKEALNNE
ncbi:hypothetical protein IIE63_000242 [Listeria monocytogenes]|uniref:hypothetical protein n=2 Tax=Listeria monocytogenes TaxID=1639 RepID=UPI00098E7B8E|nr:hypothetical protein [Listeria monocytogenes]EAC5220508.1 hypothetical protein [Listeria monocytogenes]EAC6873750.1 hypothetical protein [Listeria monocytogenes]EAD1933022.1 hypothetical protein [Listeria monocytogenes]EAD3044571.1 hypothetical protein [Listeria monocytogenes]EAF0571508.1 hypothetical protein [Listeria monocytogenes]